MRFPKIFAFLAFSVLAASCSSDNDGDNTGPVDQTDSFTYVKDEQTINVATISAQRSENFFQVSGDLPDGQSMYFQFDTFGNLGTAGSIDADFNWRNSYAYYSNNYFDFEIIGHDETNHIIKFHYSGKVYDDNYDLTSDYSEVSGTVNVHYTVVTPQVPGLGFDAKIAGQDWHHITADLSSNNMDTVQLSYYSGDEYRLTVWVNPADHATGTFNFTPSSAVNKVVLAKYNTTTHDFDELPSTGTLTITEHTSNGFGTYYYVGTFNLTAQGANGNINVTNGVFKDLYTW